MKVDADIVSPLYDLDLLLPSLRKHGVGIFKHGPMEIHFSQEPPKPMDIASVRQALQAEEPDKCKCGHSETAHVNGLCIHGCAIESCMPEEAKAP